jgi:short-subunit dehydrogenase
MKLHDYSPIVTIGSQGAVQPGANLAAYCASKAAVMALIQAIAEVVFCLRADTLRTALALAKNWG